MEVSSAPEHAGLVGEREPFHAATATSGGERNWISTAVSVSTTIIGLPHLGQSQVSRDEGLEGSGWLEGCCDVEPSN